MKRFTFSLFLFLIVFAGIGQSTPEPQKFAQVSLRKMTICESKQVTHILNALYPLSGGYVDHWGTRTEILSTTVEGISSKESAAANANAGTFTPVQKSIFENSDIGSDVHVKISYREKDLFTDEFGEIKHMHLVISVMPDIEAIYPGGMSKVIDHLRGNVIDHLPAADSTSISEKMKVAEVKFTVDENGKVIDAQISKSSTDDSIDKLLLEATSNMPAWKPAMSVKGQKVKREFTVSVDKRKMQGC